MRVRTGLVRSPLLVSPALCMKFFFIPCDSNLRSITALMHDDGTRKLCTCFCFCHLFPRKSCAIGLQHFFFLSSRSTKSEFYACMRNTVATFVGELHTLLLALVPYQRSKGWTDNKCFSTVRSF